MAFSYAYVTTLVKLEDGTDRVPSKWFDGYPKESYWTADLINDDPDRRIIQDAGKSSAMAIIRKIEQDGLPC